MPFWVLLLQIAKIILKVQKFASLLKGLSSGSLVRGLMGQFIIGEVVDGLAKAGVPVDSYKFIEQARNGIGQVLAATTKGLEKSGIEIKLEELDKSLQEHVQRLLDGLSVANALGSKRNVARGADPILFHRGEFEHAVHDMFVRGAGADLLLRRVYRSTADYLGPFGRGWDHTFNLRLSEVDADTVTRLTGNLSETRFVRHPKFGQLGYDYFTPDHGIHDVLELDGAGNFRLRRRGGSSIAYEHAGPRQHRARAIQDAAGNRIDFEYDADNRLRSVYGNGPHRYLRFFYGARDRIERIEDHAGPRCLYTYDDSGFIARSEQWTTVGGRPYLYAENYGYTVVGDNRRLASVSDERGRIVVANEYDTRPTSDTFGYVSSQYTPLGPTAFVYERFSGPPSGSLADVDTPTRRVFETLPDGHVIERILNESGNELLRREDYVEGGRIRTALLRTRYNDDGAIVARMDPEGGLTQFLFGREQAKLGPWSEFPATLIDITADRRMSFGNQLATIERGRAMAEFDRVAEQERWIAALPDVKVRADNADAIVKQVYDPHRQLLLSTSDVRATVSPDPLHVESAPAGTPGFNPGHPLAQAHRKLLTVHEYTAAGLRIQTRYPNRTRPAAMGTPPLANIADEMTAWDPRGRPLVHRDRRGHLTYWSYFPDNASPVDGAKAGYVHQELRPHLDWVLDSEFPSILEVKRTGSWAATPRGFAANNAPASLRLELHCQRVELWQSSDKAPLSTCTAATVRVDGVVHGAWNQVATPVYLIGGLTPGRHVVDVSGQVGSLSLGRVIGHVAFTYDVDLLGRVVTETDPTGVTVHTDYDSFDRVIERRRGAAASETRQCFVYDRDGHLERDETRWRDSSGAPIHGGVVRTTYQRNTRGLLALEVTRAPGDTDRRLTRYYYDPLGVLVAARNGRGVMMRWRVDALGRRVRETRAACTPDQSTTMLAYDRSGRLLRERDPEGAIRVNGIRSGGTIRSGYDARGRLQFVTDPLGHLTVTRRDLGGREMVVQRFGRRSDGTFDLAQRRAVEYDEHGDPVAETMAILGEPVGAPDPLNAPDAAFVDGIGTGAITTRTVSYELDADGRRTRIDDGTRVTRCSYDPQGRVVDERSPTGRRVLRLYDGAGRAVRTYALDPAAASDPSIPAAVFVESYRRDDHGRRIELQDAYGNVWRDEYDTLGNIEDSSDPLGRRTARRHNAFGQETQRTEGITGDPSDPPATTQSRYDSCGNLVAVVDALGRHFVFSFDALDRKTGSRNTSYPADAGSKYAYDRRGKLIREADRNGLVRVHKYDAGGRRVRTDYDVLAVPAAHTPPGQSATFITIDYDIWGTVSRLENDWTIVVQTRDSRGLLLEERTELKPSLWTPARAWRVAHSFDEAGARIGLVYPSGRAVGYKRDSAERVLEIENLFTPSAYPGSLLTTGNVILARYKYAGGRWIGGDYPVADASLTIRYDGRGQPIERILADTATMQMRWRQQTLLDSARQTAVETTTTAAGARTRYFAFDALGRVAGYADMLATWINPMTLSAPGAPAAAATPAAQAAIDALRPAGAPASTFAYDAVGNRLSSQEGGGPVVVSTPDADNRYTAVAATAWTHDAEGRLISDGTRSYRYDGEGVLSEERAVGAGAPVVEFVRDGIGRIVVVHTNIGNDYFAYLDEQTPITHWDGAGFTEYTPGREDEPMHIASAGVDEWVVSDDLRSPRFTWRRGPVPSQTFLDYRPYGAATPPGSSAGLYNFAGMLRFPGSTVLHNVHRSYIPTVGRFMQQDPAGFVDSTNRYVYARNNPVDLYDPLGLQSFPPSTTSRDSDRWTVRPSKEQLREAVAILPFFLKIPSEYFRPYQRVPANAPRGLAELWQLNGQTGVAVANFSRDYYPGSDIRTLTLLAVQAIGALTAALSPLASAEIQEAAILEIQALRYARAANAAEEARRSEFLATLGERLAQQAGYAEQGERLILDQDVTKPGTADALRKAGYNVKSVQEIFGPGGERTKDLKIKEFAELTNARVITADRGRDRLQGGGFMGRAIPIPGKAEGDVPSILRILGEHVKK